MKIASFDVDAQIGFTPLSPNELPVEGGDLIIDALNEQAKIAELRIGSKDCHPSNAIWIANEENPMLTPVKDGGTDVDVYWPAHCLVGTKGNELIPGLPAVKDYDFFVFKGVEPDLHPYGACYHDLSNKLSTGVIEFLKDRSVGGVIVGGLAENYCVATTAIQLKEAGFKVWVNLSATKSIGDPTSMRNRMTDTGIILIEKLSDLVV